jgi:RNA polymerase sigma-70 factor (ECF subfamily)
VTDAELVEQARRGDASAFGVLVDRHRHAVYRAALAAVGNAAEAEDVAQEAFVAAYRRLQTFRGEASVKTWMLTIAWNKALDRRRSLTRWVKTLAPAWDAAREPATELEHHASNAADPEQQALSVELRTQVRRLIRALPRGLRDALLLAGSGAHTYEEAAAMLGVPTGTVKWRVSEARRQLRVKLQRLGY